VAGANPSSNHPRLITQLINLRRRGGKVIIINPLSELGLKRFRLPSDARSMMFGSDVSDLYIQPTVGGDIHLFTALLKGVIETGGVDETFVSQHVDGWDTLRAHVSELSWDTLIEGSGVSRADIDECVSILNASATGIFMWAMGLTHHAHGTDNVLSTLPTGLPSVTRTRSEARSAWDESVPARQHERRIRRTLRRMGGPDLIQPPTLLFERRPPPRLRPRPSEPAHRNWETS
jgi:predicted molibdopterin-dependent oxidoreductase YjgC